MKPGNALLSIHAFSGCDFNTSFSWKEKQRGYETVHGKKRRKQLKAFGQLGDTASVPPGIAAILEEVVSDTLWEVCYQISQQSTALII